MAHCCELQQQYIDYLDALEVAIIDAGVVIEIDGEKVRFENTDDFADFVAGELNATD